MVGFLKCQRTRIGGLFVKKNCPSSGSGDGVLLSKQGKHRAVVDIVCPYKSTYIVKNKNKEKKSRGEVSGKKEKTYIKSVTPTSRHLD